MVRRADAQRITTTWPGIAHSAKNSRKWAKTRKGWRLVLSGPAARDKASLETLLSIQFPPKRDGSTTFRDHEVRVDVEVDKARQETTITVEDLGPKHHTKGRRRDLHGGLELIMDALQGIVFDDDCQVADTRIRYV